MFEYFPGNYVWNLSVLITLQNGGTIGEVDEPVDPSAKPLPAARTRAPNSSSPPGRGWPTG
jgi:hypothetical protein